MGTQKNLSPPSTIDGWRESRAPWLPQATSVGAGGKMGGGIGAGAGLGFLKRFPCHLSAFCGKPGSLEGLLRPGCIS